MGERFGIKKEDLPAYRLFVNGNSKDQIKYTGNVEDEGAIKTFVMQESGRKCFWCLFKINSL